MKCHLPFIAGPGRVCDVSVCAGERDVAWRRFQRRLRTRACLTPLLRRRCPLPSPPLASAPRQVSVGNGTLGGVLEQCGTGGLSPSELVLSVGLYNGTTRGVGGSRGGATGAAARSALSIPAPTGGAAAPLLAENFHFVWPPRFATGLRDPNLTVSDVVEVPAATDGPNAGLQVRALLSRLPLFAASPPAPRRCRRLR